MRAKFSEVHDQQSTPSFSEKASITKLPNANIYLVAKETSQAGRVTASLLLPSWVQVSLLSIRFSGDACVKKQLAHFNSRTSFLFDSLFLDEINSLPSLQTKLHQNDSTTDFAPVEYPVPKGYGLTHILYILTFP